LAKSNIFLNIIRQIFLSIGEEIVYFMQMTYQTTISEENLRICGKKFDCDLSQIG
jgi:hypothetical protein